MTVNVFPEKSHSCSYRYKQHLYRAGDNRWVVPHAHCVAGTDPLRTMLGALIRERREALGWSQERLAVALEAGDYGTVTQAAVSAWEVGRSSPRPRKLGTIEEVLGMEAGTLTDAYMRHGAPDDGRRQRVHEDDVEWEFATSAEISESTRRAMIELLRAEAERTGRVEIVIKRREPS